MAAVIANGANLRSNTENISSPTQMNLTTSNTAERKLHREEVKNSNAETIPINSVEPLVPG